MQKYTDGLSNWDDIRFFLALAREGSLSATARALGVEHTTVARRISALEQALSVKLFDRLMRGWQLTVAGDALLMQAMRIEDEMISFQRSAFSQTPLTGKVRLSVPPLLLNNFLLPYLSDFHRQYPLIELELIGELRTADLERREADIALRIAEPHQPDLVKRTLVHINYHLYAAQHVAAQPQAQWRFVGFDDSQPGLPQKVCLDKYRGKRSYALQCNDIMAMLEAAKLGWGVTLLPYFLASKHPELSCLSAGKPLMTRPLYLVMHHDVRKAPRIRLVADTLIELFSHHVDEF